MPLKTKYIVLRLLLPARRYASAGTSYGPVSMSVCHKSEFYRNEWTDRAGFWHVGFIRPMLHCVLRKFRYLQKGTSLWKFVPNSGLR